MIGRLILAAATATMFCATGARAQTTQAHDPALADASSPAGSATPAKAVDSLSLYFENGSAIVSGQGQSVLDQAARTYRDGKPIVMVVSGGTDSTGSAAANLRLSQLRADNVVQGLVARGIPVERFQVLAKGETEPAVSVPEGTAEARNRRVEITWR
jgi:outer membrane protein OmpA-like peptidoglycan-associated protein